MLRYLSLIALFFLFTASVAHGQTADTILVQVTTPVPVEQQQTNKNVKESKAGKATPKYFRHHKKLPATYSGMAIELTTSDLPLKRSYFLFEQFGNVHYEKLDEGGYAYVILVKFSSKQALADYIKNIILPKAPEAKPLIYKNGARKAK